MIKPIIGIIPTYNENDGHIYEEYDKYVSMYGRRVKEAGGVPVGLIIEDDILPEQLEMCDGFIIQGGHKIRRYVYQIIDYAIKNNKPLLGICMGSEAIDIYSVVADNVSVSEDIEATYKRLKEENDGSLLRRLDDNNIHCNDFVTMDDYNNALHKITIDKDSIAYSIFEKEEIEVPSMHNYDYKMVGKAFKVTAYAPDGVSEIIEYNNKDYFIIGTHFHVELMNTNMFKCFIDECIKRK